MRAAGFKRDKERRARGRRFPSRIALQFPREARPRSVPALADHDALADENRSNHWIGRGVPQPAASQAQSQAHEIKIAGHGCQDIGVREFHKALFITIDDRNARAVGKTGRRRSNLYHVQAVGPNTAKLASQTILAQAFLQCPGACSGVVLLREKT